MLVEQRPEQIQIAVSMLSLLDPSSTVNKIRSMIRPFQSYVAMVAEVGLDGIQWTPLNLPVAGMQIRSHMVGSADTDSILVAEQSWSSGLTFSTYITMEERVASLRSLARLQQFLGRKLPVVLYPRQPKDKTSHRRFDFDQRLFQPVQSIIDQQRQTRYSTISPCDFLNNARIMEGFTGYAVDTFHLRKDGQELANWQVSIPRLAPLTKLVHVSVGRSDQASNRIDTHGELVDLLDGTEKTDLPKMIKTIRDLGWRGTYVIEAVPSEFYAANADKRRVPEDDVIGGSLQLIGHNLRKLLA